MHTPEQLRAALHDLADAMPDTAELPADSDELLPAAKRSPRSPRRSMVIKLGAPALAGAAVVGVVVGAVALSSGSHRAAQPGSSLSPSPKATHLTIPSWFTTTVFDVKGLTGATVGGVSADEDSQQLQVSFDGFRSDSRLGIVRVWAPGHWTPSRPADAQDVRVNGKPGFYGKIPSQWDGEKGKAVGLTWQYAPGAWAAVMRQTSASKADLLRIATAVRTGLRIPARLPFKLTDLPPGGQIITLEWRLGAGRQGAGGGLTISYPGRHGRLVISADPLSAGEFGKPTTIGGKRVWVDGKVREIAGPGVSRAILEPTTPDYSHDIDLFTPAETSSLVAGFTFASNVKDPSTWFDATTALP
jgi:hypothetical protein